MQIFGMELNMVLMLVINIILVYILYRVKTEIEKSQHLLQLLCDGKCVYVGTESNKVDDDRGFQNMDKDSNRDIEIKEPEKSTDEDLVSESKDI